MYLRGFFILYLKWISTFERTYIIFAFNDAELFIGNEAFKLNLYNVGPSPKLAKNIAQFLQLKYVVDTWQFLYLHHQYSLHLKKLNSQKIMNQLTKAKNVVKCSLANNLSRRQNEPKSSVAIGATIALLL